MMLNPNDIQILLKTMSMPQLAKHYDYSVSHFRRKLRKLNIDSPRKAGERLNFPIKTFCNCSAPVLKGRSLCRECFNKKKRLARLSRN